MPREARRGRARPAPIPSSGWPIAPPFLRNEANLRCPDNPMKSRPELIFSGPAANQNEPNRPWYGSASVPLAVGFSDNIFYSEFRVSFGFRLSDLVAATPRCVGACPDSDIGVVQLDLRITICSYSTQALGHCEIARRSPATSRQG